MPRPGIAELSPGHTNRPNELGRATMQQSVDVSDQPDHGAELITTGLTGTGQVLGTPSYMPPEQAVPRRGQVGPASDVYALGAILYELLTGRPPFRAETPLDTMIQVLENEPAPPRLLSPKIPRDGDYLPEVSGKGARRRYATAEQLAEDLGRFLNDEPIRARPVGYVGRTWRWVRRQRRSVIAGAVAATVAALVVPMVIAGWSVYKSSLLGYVLLKTEGPALTAEMLSVDSDDQVVPRFSIPTAEKVAIPAGSYRLRLSSPGLLGQTYHLHVERGGTHELHLGLDDRRLRSPIEVPGPLVMADLDGATDLFLITIDYRKCRVSLRTPRRLWLLG
jgi:hypothetical protein